MHTIRRSFALPRATTSVFLSHKNSPCEIAETCYFGYDHPPLVTTHLAEQMGSYRLPRILLHIRPRVGSRSWCPSLVLPYSTPFLVISMKLHEVVVQSCTTIVKTEICALRNDGRIVYNNKSRDRRFLRAQYHVTQCVCHGVTFFQSGNYAIAADGAARRVGVVAFQHLACRVGATRCGFRVFRRRVTLFAEIHKVIVAKRACHL